MPNLRQINIVYTVPTNIKKMASALQEMISKSVHSVVLEGFPFEGNFRCIVDAFQFFPVEAIVCRNCQRVSMKNILHVLEVLPSINFV